MAVEIRSFTVTIPAGTQIAAGFSASLAIPPRTVRQIDVRVPPGPRGEVGFGIGAAGNTIVPYGGLAYIVTDDQALSFPLENTITSGAWALYGYNTGDFDHRIYIYFHLDLVGATAPDAAPTPVPIQGSDTTETTAAPTPEPLPPAPPEPAAPPAPAPVPEPAPTPPAPVTPIVLPPAAPSPPGAVLAARAGGPPMVMLAPVGVAQVWLLQDGDYGQLTDQDVVNTMVSTGIPGASVSAAQHAALLAAAGRAP